MRNTISIIILVCLSFFANAQEFSLMTYNIKLDYPEEGPNSWDQRKDWMIGQIDFYAPDIFGVQEAMPNQMKDLDSIMPDYNFVGVGRDDGKNKGEYSAIFYNKYKFNIKECSTFWLSQTPEKASLGWDAANHRVCTYGLFEDIVSKEQFWVFNTHFDHVGVVARTNSTKLILQKIVELTENKLPIVLMGDFNLEPENENIQFIKTILEDSKEISLSAPFGPKGTFNNFDFNTPVTRRIDYIFVSKNNIEVNKYAVLSDNRDLKYPSDHLPVYVQIKLNN